MAERDFYTTETNVSPSVNYSSTVTPSSTSCVLENDADIDYAVTTNTDEDADGGDDTYDPDDEEDDMEHTWDDENGGDEETCWDDYRSMCRSMRSLNKKANLAIICSTATAAVLVLGVINCILTK